MSQFFLGQILMTGFNFAPKGFALCDGQVLSIQQNSALFSLLGTTYGGNGQITFALPDMRARVPMHVGGAHVEGEFGGEPTHTVTLGEMPSHSHVFYATTNAADAASAGNNMPAKPMASGAALYALNQSPGLEMQAMGATNPQTGGQAHSNMMPSLTISFAIALEGIFPSRN